MTEAPELGGGGAGCTATHVVWDGKPQRLGSYPPRPGEIATNGEQPMTPTKNTQLMATEVAQHIAADAVIQGDYWDDDERKGCFIGCLGHSSDPTIAVQRFGLTLPLLRIAESIFEGLPADEAKSFFAAFPGAIGCDGRDLSLVHWQFLGAELRALPAVPASIQAVIDPVIAGMDLLASGQEWPSETAARAARAAGAAEAAARAAAGAAGAAAWAAAWAAEAAARAAAGAAWVAAGAAEEAAAWAARAAEAAAGADARRRQRDLLLSLVSQAPVVEVQQ